MEEAILRIGLPVTCASCGEKGFVKPSTDYGGWFRRNLLQNKRWYCPIHAEAVKKLIKKMSEQYRTPEPELTTQEELYKLLD